MRAALGHGQERTGFSFFQLGDAEEPALPAVFPGQGGDTFAIACRGQFIVWQRSQVARQGVALVFGNSAVEPVFVRYAVQVDFFQPDAVFLVTLKIGHLCVCCQSCREHGLRDARRFFRGKADDGNAEFRRRIGVAPRHQFARQGKQLKR